MIEKKRFWIIVAAIVAAEVLAAIVWRCCFFPEREVSDLYQRYCHTPGIDATFIRDYQVNDTLFVDATLLHATDSASWERLLNDFHLSIIMSNRQSPISDIFRFAKKGQTKPIIDTNMLNNDFFVFSQAEKRITIFHITNEDQIELCISCQLKQTLKQ